MASLRIRLAGRMILRRRLSEDEYLVKISSIGLSKKTGITKVPDCVGLLFRELIQETLLDRHAKDAIEFLSHSYKLIPITNYIYLNNFLTIWLSKRYPMGIH